LKTKICRQPPKIKKNGKIRGRLAGLKVLKKSNVKIFLLTKRANFVCFSAGWRKCGQNCSIFQDLQAQE